MEIMEKDRVYMEHASYTWSKDSIRLILTPSNQAKQIYYYIQEVGYFKTAFPYFTERKNLNSYLMIYTISGVGHLEYEGATWEIKQGQCFLLDCMEYHKYCTQKENQWEFLWVHFSGGNIKHYYEEINGTGFQVFNIKDKFFLESTMWRMIRIHQKKNSTTEIITSNLLYQMICELLIQRVTNDAGTFFIPSYIKEIAKIIEQHYKEEIRLDQLEQKFHRSKYHMAKEFKKYIGVTIHEYIIVTRISYAKELLKYSDCSVNEITYKVGMNNVSHFINLFKVREHLTPLAYRKEWGE